MLFKEPSFVSPTENENKRDRWERQPKNSSKVSFCRVCGDKANIINYGALSCQSCKTFFRRNGSHPQIIRSCSFKRACEVNIRTRRCCTNCRLAKCFSVGMSTDFIRKQNRKNTPYSSSLSSKSNINELTVYDQPMSVPQLPISDPSDDNQSLLASYEQKVLSNVVHALEIYSAIPKVRRIIKDLSASSFGLCFDMTDAIEIIILIHTSMRSFVNSIPDFQILTVAEQCSLFDRNLNGIVSLYSAIVFRDAGLINNAHCIQSFASIYGLEMMVQATRINKQLDLDLTMIELMLLVVAFSSNCSIVDFQQGTHDDSLLSGTYRLLGSQNVYVEVLWKYTTYQYGYYDSALRFARLIKLFLDLIKYSANSYMNNITYRGVVNDFNQKTKQLLVNNQHKLVQLWGMTTL